MSHEIMKEQYFKWHNKHIDKDMEMLVFGEKGYPVIIYPTSMGSYTQNKDFNLIDSVEWFVNSGLIKVYTPSSIDNDSWYNKKIHPRDRVLNHMKYEQAIMEDVVERAMKETGSNKVALAGCSFGAYHATNFAFRHPELVGYLINMGGAYDIKMQLDGYYDDNCYYNNPPDFLPGLENPALYEMGIILGTGEHDNCLDKNQRLSNILSQKGIPHWLDNRQGANHDWPVWREMLPTYISQLNLGK